MRSIIPQQFSRNSILVLVFMSGPGHTGRNLVRVGHILMIRQFNFHINHLSFVFVQPPFPRSGASAPPHTPTNAGPARATATAVTQSARTRTDAGLAVHPFRNQPAGPAVNDDVYEKRRVRLYRPGRPKKNPRNRWPDHSFLVTGPSRAAD